jgi:hypothetical protein
MKTVNGVTLEKLEQYLDEELGRCAGQFLSDFMEDEQDELIQLAWQRLAEDKSIREIVHEWKLG